MLLSVELAKEKWCPYVRQNGPQGAFNMNVEYNPASSRGVVRERVGTCIANRCMVWRWGADKNGNTMPLGYCGLAGIPEGVRE